MVVWRVVGSSFFYRWGIRDILSVSQSSCRSPKVMDELNIRVSAGASSSAASFSIFAGKQSGPEAFLSWRSLICKYGLELTVEDVSFLTTTWEQPPSVFEALDPCGVLRQPLYVSPKIAWWIQGYGSSHCSSKLSRLIFVSLSSLLSLLYTRCFLRRSLRILAFIQGVCCFFFFLVITVDGMWSSVAF